MAVPRRASNHGGLADRVIAEEQQHAVPTNAVVDCAVVIVTYNSGQDIDALLDSLPAAAGGLSQRVIVVDNGSADDTVARVQARDGVELIETGANLGYAAAINVGRARARPCRSVAVLNPDLRVEPGALRRLFNAAGGEVGVTVPTLVGPDGGRLRSLRRDPTIARALGEALFGDRFPGRPACAAELVREDEAYEHEHPVDWATGAALLITEACDRAVGDWEPMFFLYSEEVDHAYRVRRAGLRIQFVPAAVAVHREGGSGSSPDLVALMAVNRVRLHARYHGAVAAAGYRAAMILHALLRIGQPGQRAALRALLGRPGSAWLRSVLTTGRPPV
jgi:GT2 family glycosyltransferase